MSIATNLAKLGLGVSATGVIAPEKGGTGTTTGGGNSSNFPTVTTISYTGDDTATNPAGGDTITLTGTNFAVGVNVLIGITQVSQVTRVSATQLTFIAPANVAGSYILYVVNPDGSSAISVPGLQYSGMPIWTTSAGSLGSAGTSVSFSTTLAATGDAPISYAIVSGALPAGVTLNTSTGVIGGTTPSVASSTTYNFTIRATDAQNQDTNRAFSLLVSPAIPPTVDYLIVASGGGGGYGSGGGGGGGGGLLTGSGYSVAAGSTYTVTVGAGGAYGTQGSASASPGANSSITGFTAIGGGGGGGSYNATKGLTGGSGGGSSMGTSAVATLLGGVGTDGQGNMGGMAVVISPYSTGWTAAGGGGAGQIGRSATNYDTGGSYGGFGGAGLALSITGTSVTYGAGGQAYYPTSGGAAGDTNKGDGGDGARTASSVSAGWDGGSGVVVIAYPNTYPALTVGGGLTYDQPSRSGYRVYRFTLGSGTITF